MNNSFTSWDAELHHSGIKGQKWGVRRWQNPDGTLTEAGRRRYGNLSNFKRLTDKRPAKYLTDAELKARIQRAKLEEQYKESKPGRKLLDSFTSIMAEHDRAKEAKRSQDLKEKELDTRRIEAVERAAQAKQQAKQAKQQAKQAKSNFRRDKVNKKVNIIKAWNERRKAKLVKWMSKHNFVDKNKYRDYLDGKITIDQVLGLNKADTNQSGSNSQNNDENKNKK